jgi:hypothetical protein
VLQRVKAEVGEIGDDLARGIDTEDTTGVRKPLTLLLAHDISIP